MKEKTTPITKEPENRLPFRNLMVQSSGADGFGHCVQRKAHPERQLHASGLETRCFQAWISASDPQELSRAAKADMLKAQGIAA
ncbi:MAG: hypothetical protein QF614_07760 [SAR324 cluster bacterium]|nr:hypothetical protein [SAR324 cluster bacterium]